jgi:hypothetical protein
LKKYFILLFALTLLSTKAAAYTLISSSNGGVPAWASMPVPFWINQSGSPQIANGSEFTAIQSAFQTWQNVANAKVSFNYKGTTPVPTVGQDGLNVVTFVDDTVPLGSETIATTFSYFTVDGTGSLVIQEADIAFSTTVPFSTSGDPNGYDIQAVATHEIGHFLGLDHSPLLSSVMTPYSVAGQLDQRVLSYDDIAALIFLYPASSSLSALGSINGFITLNNSPVFGAHVVALDANGNVVASSLSFVDGSYEIDSLPPGAYRLYAEPLDGPFTEQNVGGTVTSAFSGLDTNFGTTYSGSVADLSHATLIQVVGGRSVTSSIRLLPASSVNLTMPNIYAMHLPLAGQTTLSVGGVGIVPGASFSASSSGVSVGTPTYGGSIGAMAPTSAQLPLTATSTATTGPKSIAVAAGGASSVLSGAVVIVNPQPSNILVAPTNGSVDGGTQVSISGLNFRSGAQVYFGGLSASNVQVVSATAIQATVPANSVGPANLVVVNSDGTWGIETNAFTYTSLPPQISNVSPLTGSVATLLTITGAEFSSRISDVDVRFNGKSANVVSTNRTAITVLVPAGASSGPITVSIAGQVVSGPAFTVTTAEPSTNFAPITANFIDAVAGGTTLPFGNNDDATALSTLPFTFTLFDRSYAAGSTIAISTNGWISLDAFTAPEFANGPLPGSSVQGSNGQTSVIPPALIAPFFEDLTLSATSSVSVRTVGSAPNRQFVVEWLNAGILDEQGNDVGASITFESILYEGTNDTEFVYRSMTGPRADGSAATIGIQNSARTQAVQTGYNQSVVSSGSVIGYHFINGSYGPVTAPPLPIDTQYSISDRGGLSVITDGVGSNTATGFATVQPSANSTAPSGVAIFGYRLNNVLVSEAGVPASPLLQNVRIYAEIGGSVNTGLAIANPNSQAASISFYFTNSSGTDLASGTINVPANGHIAKFLNDPSFNAVTNFQGTFTLSSTVPIAVIALRGFTNERNEFLMSTLPVTDLSASVANTPAVLPHFADGGGWRTQVILVNPTDTAMTGSIQFVTSGGQTISTSPYSIPKRSSFKQVTAGTGAAIQTGSIQIIADSGNSTPTSLAVFSNRPNGVTVSEAAVLPATGLALRTYVEVSGNSGAVGSINSGIAMANTSANPVTVTFDLTDLNGNTLGSASTTIQGRGQVAKFLDELFPKVSLPVKGVLRISSAGAPVAVAALRGRYNERQDFLMSTTPPTNEAVPAVNALLVFPHIVNGGGFTTQFILFSGAANQTASGDLHLTYAN